SARSSRLPVIVYIHGESLEWNAGTPYDGSVLAAYGNVIVVTFNFRLGILGFLRPGVHDNTVSNFGLLDQVAALQWVKDNIEALGGDPHSVTLMGHTTGAACAALLLVSPVSSSLFRRAVLMSGTALSDWALTPSPLQYTIQVAEGLNCPLSDELAACLRRKRLSDLLAVAAKVSRPDFKTPFGPVVDGSVIPNEPERLMGEYRELFSRYELLLGVTEQEAYHLLDAKSLSFGVEQRDRDALLKRYTHARFEKLPDVALARTLAEYAQDPALAHPVAAEGQRDLLLAILSDARVTAPVVRTAELHAEAKQKSFLYVFTHRTKARNYPAVDQSVQGDELAYVFGLPLTPANLRPGRTFTLDEKHLAEQVITLWTNFAKTGDPNIPRTQSHLYWREFDSHSMAYLNISIPSSVEYRYREQQMKYWNHDLPRLLRDPQSARWPDRPDQDQDEDDDDTDDREGGAAYGVPRLYRPRPRDPYDQEHRPVYGTLVNGQGDTPQPVGALGGLGLGGRRTDLDVTVGGLGRDHDDEQAEEVSRVAPSTLALSVVIVVGISFLLVNVCAFGFLYYKKNRLRMQQQFFTSQCRGGGLDDDGDDAYTKKAPTQADGAFSCGASPLPPPAPPPLPPPHQHRPSLGQRIRLLLGAGSARPGRRQARGAGVGAPSGPGHGPGHGHGHGRADSRDDLYEAVRGASRSTSRLGRARTSRDDTADVHSMSKVRDWVAQEVVQRCSPGFLRRGRRPSGKAPLSPSSSLDQAEAEGRPERSAAHSPTAAAARPAPTLGPGPAVQKVSVAVDATPAARSSSVLRQLPIELSKSMDETSRCGTQGEDARPGPGPGPSGSAVAGMTRSTPALCSRPSLQRGEAVSADEPDGPERRRSTASIHLDLQPSVVDILVAPGPHSPPASPPSSPPAQLHSFLGARDVNVTSRDEHRDEGAAPGGEQCGCGPEEALDNIRRRNFP
ncbi:Neuroligin-3, partial [Frankliniella fusca]